MQPPNPRAQFESWWRANEARFRGFARHYAGGDEGIAEDATQEAGHYIWGRWADYGPTPADPVAFQILRHRVIDQLRRRGGFVAGPEAVAAEPAGGSDAGEDLAVQEALRDQEACLDGLPETPAQPMRTVHVLHQAGLSDREVAAQLSIPYSRARRLHDSSGLPERPPLP
jgi:DNA-directed RNA polymerase specialized sigma24 family protein